VRGAAQVANAALGVATPQSDDARDKPRERARARQAVIVDPKSQIAVGTGGVGRQQAPIEVAHGLRVTRGAVPMPMIFALARAIAQRRRQPEVSGWPRGARARHGDAQQRVDALQREIRRVFGLGPPDVRAGLEDHRRRVRGIACSQLGEVTRGGREIAAVQRVQSRAQRDERIGFRVGGNRALNEQHDDEQRLHVSAARW